jgi:CheY-like chemotaxis protein
MGGDILVESEIDKGTTFTVLLPVDVREEIDIRDTSTIEIPASFRPITPSSETGTVLIIDDDPAVRDLVARSLAREGYKIEIAVNGEEGYHKAKALKPDAITLDVMMEGLDGWSVLSLLKADPELADIPVVMITIVDDKKRGFALGASAYLTKPIDRKLLVGLLKRYHRYDDSGESGRVLIIEDDADIREMLSRTLIKEGWQVRDAENGLRGLESLNEVTPDLILLDLMMPEMDGFQFVAELQNNEEWRTIPIIVITAKDLTSEDRRLLNGYVEGVLAKHAYSRDELLREVSKIVNQQIKRNSASD